MVTAYIMVKANTGDVDRLRTEMLAIDQGIESAHVVAGDVDFIVKVGVDAPAEVKTIATAIQGVEGIEDTQTYIAMD